MKPLHRRLTLLEATHSAAGGEIESILISSVWRDEQGELKEKPYMLMIPGDPVRYMVADYEAWPDDVKARYDGR